MPRSMWKGVVSFGLVAIPVRLYLATEDHNLEMHLLCPTDNTRIRQKRWCPIEDKEIAWNEAVRGYEVAKDEFVILTDAELDALKLESTSAIELVQFCDQAEVEDIMLQKSYYLEPEKTGQKAFYLLKRALENTGLVGIGKIAFHDREHLVRISSRGAGLLMQTLHWPDEIRAQTDLKLPESEVVVNENELGMAVMLVQNLTQTFDWGSYSDKYRTAVEALVQEKLEKGSIPAGASEAKAPVAVNLMEALKASLAAGQRQKEMESASPPGEVRELAGRRQARVEEEVTTG